MKDIYAWNSYQESLSNYKEAKEDYPSRIEKYQKDIEEYNKKVAAAAAPQTDPAYEQAKTRYESALASYKATYQQKLNDAEADYKTAMDRYNEELAEYNAYKNGNTSKDYWRTPSYPSLPVKRVVEYSPPKLESYLPYNYSSKPASSAYIYKPQEPEAPSEPEPFAGVDIFEKYDGKKIKYSINNGKIDIVGENIVVEPINFQEEYPGTEYFGVMFSAKFPLKSLKNKETLLKAAKNDKILFEGVIKLVSGASPETGETDGRYIYSVGYIDCKLIEAISLSSSSSEGVSSGSSSSEGKKPVYGIYEID